MTTTPSSSCTTANLSPSGTTTDDATERLQSAAERAVQLVRHYADIDPYQGDGTDDDGSDGIKSSTNPWHNPNEILSQLSAARDDLAQAWTELKEAHEAGRPRDDDDDEYVDDDNNNDANNVPKKEVPVPEEEFRVLFMDMVTDAFGDVLDQMRQEAEQNGTNIDVDILVDCLQSGMDFLDPNTEHNYQSYFDSLEASTTEDDPDDGSDTGGGDNTNLTQHEIRQRSLGYLVSPAFATTGPAANDALPVDGSMSLD